LKDTTQRDAELAMNNMRVTLLHMDLLMQAL